MTNYHPFLIEMDITSFIGKFMKKKTRGFWGNLVRTNTGVSSLNFYLIATTLVGIGLLATVVFAIIWEELHNNSMTSDISGWATFVGAVGTLFASAGIAKGWSNWSEQKFGKKNETDNSNMEETDGDLTPDL